ncbi:MAG: HDOD domain-containing protein [Pseudomonadota bacterium]
MSINRNILKELDEIETLPTLPPVALKVNAQLQDLDISIKKLSETIEKDQAMASKILKLVNSAFFGLSTRIGNIQHAIVLLGFNTVRNAVVTVSTINTFNTFSKNENIHGFDVKTFWKHSITVAATSRHLALLSRLHPPEDAFMGGLLHDIGKFVLFCYFRDEFLKVWEQIRDQGCSFYEAERKVLGISHDRIGGRLAKKWKLPDDIVNAILYHHRLEKNPGSSSPPMLVHAADALVNGWESSGSKPKKCRIDDPKAQKLMGGYLDNAGAWYPEICNDVDSVCRLLLEA